MSSPNSARKSSILPAGLERGLSDLGKSIGKGADAVVGGVKSLGSNLKEPSFQKLEEGEGPESARLTRDT